MTSLPYDAMRREVTVTANISTQNTGNQESSLVLANSLSPNIVDEEVSSISIVMFITPKLQKYFEQYATVLFVISVNI